MTASEPEVDQAALNTQLEAALSEATARFTATLDQARAEHARDIDKAVEAFKSAGGVFNVTPG